MATSSRAALSRSQSLNSIPSTSSSPSRSLGKTRTDPSLEYALDAAPSPSPRPLSVRKTYGKARSFVTEDDGLLKPAAAGVKSPTLGLKRESYSDFRKRTGADADEEEEVDESQVRYRPDLRLCRVHYPQGSQTAMNTLVELRTQGESRRFGDELGYLLEGLERTEPLNVRRARCGCPRLSQTRCEMYVQRP